MSSADSISCVDLTDKVYVWSAAGDGKRESFAADQPVVLLRMRDKPRPTMDDPADVPGQALWCGSNGARIELGGVAQEYSPGVRWPFSCGEGHAAAIGE
ncbi:hypothetical protein [Anatilimnocola floriformis]|uniref:hypothetical protein n=1 Tax=Anatilimnocola floriformis TaxID=2948575 RepID=UPI0020C2B011|nr:hypothetical protein [Anatilimnocola floriformis]